MISLLRTDEGWVVGIGKSTHDFNTIELAAEFLVSGCRVEDDEIDEAIIDMSLSGKDKALFQDGKFKESVSSYDN